MAGDTIGMDWRNIYTSPARKMDFEVFNILQTYMNGDRITPMILKDSWSKNQQWNVLKPSLNQQIPCKDLWNMMGQS